MDGGEDGDERGGLVVVPWGVLGRNEVEQVAVEPGEGTIIVDVLSKEAVQGGVAACRGSSRAVYEWLGVSPDEQFTEYVKTNNCW
jgi:hypothetical protein